MWYIWSFFLLTSYFQMVGHGSELLENRVGALPGGQKLAGSVENQDHHSISGLELLWLGCPVVVPLLGLAQVVPD